MFVRHAHNEWAEWGVVFLVCLVIVLAFSQYCRDVPDMVVAVWAVTKALELAVTTHIWVRFPPTTPEPPLTVAGVVGVPPAVGTSPVRSPTFESSHPHRTSVYLA